MNRYPVMRFALLLRADLAALAGLLDNADEHVFQREAPFARLKHAHSSRFQLLRGLANTGIHFAIRDDVQPFAEKSDPPPLRLRLQNISRLLWLVHAEFQ